MRSERQTDHPAGEPGTQSRKDFDDLVSRADEARKRGEPYVDVASERQTGPDAETRAFGFTREQFAVVARWMARAEKAEAELARVRVDAENFAEALRRIGDANPHIQAGEPNPLRVRADRAEARVAKARAVVQDALHALAYGHTDVAMERLGKALREFGCDAENGETA